MDAGAISTSTLTTVPRPDPAAPSGARDALGKDDFLRLLTAQLANQDPLKPVDNQAFVAQLAQFASLEQLHGVSDRLDSLVLASASQTQLGAASLVGRDVVFRADGLDVEPGSAPAPMQGTLAARAAVTAVVQDSNGRAVRALSLGALEAGDFRLAWDGRDDRGNVVAPGRYTLTVTARADDGTLTPIDLRASGRVKGVDYSSGGPELVVGASRIKLSDVSQITQP
jgi:flagellar basal-body rod modification protein FlgD